MIKLQTQMLIIFLKKLHKKLPCKKYKLIVFVFKGKQNTIKKKKYKIIFNCFSFF